LCRQRFAHSGLRGEFCIANAEEVPFPNDFFDCVCAMGVLHHVPDTVRAVEEIFRVLKPGGRLIVMVYHRDSLQYRFKFPLLHFLTHKSLQQLVNEVDGVGNPKGNVYSRAELRSLLSQFKELQMFTGLLSGQRFWRKLGQVTGLERWWGWFLYAKGIKPKPSDRMEEP